MWCSDAPSESYHLLMFPCSLIHFSSSLHFLIPVSPLSLLLPILSSLHSFYFSILPLVSLMPFLHTNCTCLCPGHSSAQHCAQDHSFPHAYNRVKMPDFMKSWLVRHQDNDACLLTGGVAFQAASIMSGESFKFMWVLEKRIQELEKECYIHKTDLDGG